MGWTPASLCTSALPTRASALSPPRTESDFLFKAHPAYTKMPPGTEVQSDTGKGCLVPVFGLGI